MRRTAVVAVLLASAVAGAGCKKTLAFHVTVERGNVTEDVYRLRVTGDVDGDPRPELLFPPEGASLLELPTSFGITLDVGTTGTASFQVEALGVDGTTVVGVASGSVTLPANGHGDVDTSVTLSTPTDGDGDMVPDALDNCPGDANPGQDDCDTDGEGDVCDAACGCCPVDMDGDGIADSADNCPLVSNPLQEDTVPAAGPDGVGDACGDFDGDLSGDLDDCAPEDGAVFPGNVDLCDGVDADCASGVCAFDLAGLNVYDLAVSSAGRVGITVDGAAGAGTGAFRTLDGNDPTTATLTTSAITDPRGVAVNIAPQHVGANADLFYVTDPTAGLLRDHFEGGSPAFAGYPLVGAGNAVAVSPFGELALVPLGTANSVVVFDPCETAGPDCYEAAGNTTMLDPISIDLVTTSTATPNPGLGLDTAWRVRAMALRPGSVINFPQVAYLIFDGQAEIVGLSVNPATLEGSAGASGLVPMSGAAPATGLFFDAANDDLLATSGDGTTDGELRVFAANDITSMMTLLSTTSVPGAGVPSCPEGVALGTDGTTLWIADSCNDVVWEGTKSADGMTVTLTTAHSVCAVPSHVGVVAAPGGDVVYVGCDGALGVVGSD